MSIAIHFCEVHPEALLARHVPGHEEQNPEMCLHDLVIHAWKRCSKAAFDGLATQIGDFLSSALYNFKDSQYPLCTNAKEGLQKLQQAGFRLAMISNRRCNSAKAILRNLHVAEMFDYIEAPADTSEAKIKPLSHILEKYGIPKDRPQLAVFIGDSNLDIASAHDHDLPSIAVTTGMGSRRVLELEKPMRIVRNLVDAACLLDELRADWDSVCQKHLTELAARRPRL